MVVVHGENVDFCSCGEVENENENENEQGGLRVQPLELRRRVGHRPYVRGHGVQTRSLHTRERPFLCFGRL